VHLREHGPLPSAELDALAARRRAVGGDAGAIGHLAVGAELEVLRRLPLEALAEGKAQPQALEALDRLDRRRRAVGGAAAVLPVRAVGPGAVVGCPARGAERLGERGHRVAAVGRVLAHRGLRRLEARLAHRLRHRRAAAREGAARLPRGGVASHFFAELVAPAVLAVRPLALRHALMVLLVEADARLAILQSERALVGE
jgi:hypothetical protein